MRSRRLSNRWPTSGAGERAPRAVPCCAHACRYVVKVCLFQFVNSYISLCYVAFVKATGIQLPWAQWVDSTQVSALELFPPMAMSSLRCITA